MALTNQQVVNGLLEMFKDGTADPGAVFQVSVGNNVYYEVDKLTYLVTEEKEQQSAIAEVGALIMLLGSRARSTPRPARG
jgi:hypothetical protein